MNFPAQMPVPVLHTDEDVMRVLTFMAVTTPAQKLIGVAAAINQLAPALWAQHGGAYVAPLELRWPKIEAGPSQAEPPKSNVTDIGQFKRDQLSADQSEHETGDPIA